MNLDGLLVRLDGVKPTSRGFLARCPAHADKSPSLSICLGNEGRILLYCFAGCSNTEILASLGLTFADLFPDRDRSIPLRKPVIQRIDRNQIAFDIKLHSDVLVLRAEAVLAVARGLDASAWTDEDINLAMQSVAIAYRDLEQAEMLRGVAFGVRLSTREEWTQQTEENAVAA